MRFFGSILRPLFFFKSVLRFLWPLVLAIFWCEYLVYYVANCACAWPALAMDNRGSVLTSEHVKAIVLSDTHLLGNRRGHPLDKLRREWQMYRSFQSAITCFEPDLVIVLGDIFDEGLIASPAEFQQYTSRFYELFDVSPSTKVIVTVGNHDIGFHDRVVAFEPYLRNRFEHAFNTTLVQLTTIRGISFISVNSMALEGDNCAFCSKARKLIKLLSKKINSSCVSELSDEDERTRPPENDCKNSQRPIVLTHFPLYRISEELCTENDGATGSEKTKKFLPRIDCISEESTNFLLRALQPRLVLTGHTHHGCVTYHKNENIPEWTVASFSWRNRPNPSFLLLTLSTENFAISKCFLPNEHTVIVSYFLALLVFIVNVYLQLTRKLKQS